MTECAAFTCGLNWREVMDTDAFWRRGRVPFECGPSFARRVWEDILRSAKNGGERGIRTLGSGKATHL